MQLATKLKLSEDESLILYISALFHDVGKVFISNEILNKPAKLTDEEYEIVKVHSNKGYDISKSVLIGLDFPKDVPLIIRYHHERFDGNGYPDGLTADAIPILSRIITLADTVDAMQSRRSYKTHFDLNEIIIELKRCSGSQFDPFYTNTMIDVLKDNYQIADISTISKTNFIPLASISFEYGDEREHKSLTGNLVLNESIGKLLVHSENNLTLELEDNKMRTIKLGFFSMQRFEQFTCKVESILGMQLILSEIEHLPSDKYFSVIWDLDTSIEIGTQELRDVKIINIGGDNLLIEANPTMSEELYRLRNQVMLIKFDVKLESLEDHFEIEGRSIGMYDFGDKSCFNINYLSLKASVRDRLFRAMFRKQIERKLK